MTTHSILKITNSSWARCFSELSELNRLIAKPIYSYLDWNAPETANLTVESFFEHEALF